MAAGDAPRLLLALDACCEPSMALADAVATLAARLDAEIEGLFVEDVELLRAAALPFVREVSATGAERTITPEALRARSRDVSRSLERLLGQAAEARRIRWRFRTAEGERIATAFAASQHCDLLVPPRATRRPPSTGPVAEMLHRVAVVITDPRDVDRALPVVHALARNGHTRDVVLVGPAQPTEELTAALAQERLRTFRQVVPVAELAGLLAAIRLHTPGLLIAPRTLLAPPTAARAFESLPMSMLLLR